MSQIRAESKTSKWAISKHEFLAAYHYSLQYHEWKDKCKGIIGMASISSLDGMPRSGKTSNPTEQQGIEIAKYSEKIKIIEATVKETDESLYPWLLKAVTCEKVTYNYLRQIMNIPCGKNVYYDRRRKYYYLLAKKLEVSN